MALTKSSCSTIVFFPQWVTEKAFPIRLLVTLQSLLELASISEWLLWANVQLWPYHDCCLWWWQWPLVYCHLSLIFLHLWLLHLLMYGKVITEGKVDSKSVLTSLPGSTHHCCNWGQVVHCGPPVISTAHVTIGACLSSLVQWQLGGYASLAAILFSTVVKSIPIIQAAEGRVATFNWFWALECFWVMVVSVCSRTQNLLCWESMYTLGSHPYTLVYTLG